MTNDPKIIVALDYASGSTAWDLVKKLDPKLCRVKVGHQLFTNIGPDLVTGLIRFGFDVFLDLKFHDTPSTVAAACKTAADLGVWMINVHASGGRRMMEAAVQSLDGLKTKPLLIGVTVLTSMGEDELPECGIKTSLAKQSRRLASLAKSCKLDGVVCSALEAAELRVLLGTNFLLVTPGIRQIGNDPNDQVRVATPSRAISAGANYLVIGRPITQSPDPIKTVNEILAEIEPIRSHGYEHYT